MKLSLAMIKRSVRQHEKRLRFIVAGGINTVIGLSFFPMLLIIYPWFYKNYMIALIISQIICTIIAFFIYKTLVFRTRGQSIFREFYTFVSFYFVNYVMNIVALPALVKGLRISPIYAQPGFTVALIVGSYFWHSHITFKSGAQTG